MATPNSNCYAYRSTFVGAEIIEMATANVSEAPCSLQPPPSPTPQGIFRPTISSMRRSSRAPTVHVGGVALTFRVPSLPKLHRRGPLVSTKLCETVSIIILKYFLVGKSIWWIQLLNRGGNLTPDTCLTCPIHKSTTSFWSTTVYMTLTCGPTIIARP